jgi:hypothetical protein
MHKNELAYPLLAMRKHKPLYLIAEGVASTPCTNGDRTVIIKLGGNKELCFAAFLDLTGIFWLPKEGGDKRKHHIVIQGAKETKNGW